jgi:hypothetical protein
MQAGCAALGNKAPKIPQIPQSKVFFLKKHRPNYQQQKNYVKKGTELFFGH